MVFIGGVGSGVAMTMTSLDVERITVFEGEVQESDFTVVESDLDVRGRNLVVNTVTIENTDPEATHNANVTMYVENASGSTIASQSLNTGDVGPDSTTTLTFRITSQNLVNEYETTVVVIEQ